MNLRLPLLATLFATTFLLSGCDIEALLADPKVAQRAADAKAIGSACRHGLRSIEDCYALNEKASKAGIFEGWKEMDQYMRENNIEGIVPKGSKPAAKTDEVIDETAVEEKPVDKPADKPTAKPAATPKPTAAPKATDAPKPTPPKAAEKSAG